MIAALLLCLQTKSAPAIGDNLPPLHLRTTQQQPYCWQPGKTTVLTFCAFWCDTWKQQLPRVQESAQAAKGLPVDFLTISVDGRWIDKGKTAGNLLADAGGAESHKIGIDRVPYTLVVDPSGKIVWSSYGTIRTEELTHIIRSTTVPQSNTGVPPVNARAYRRDAGATLYLTFDDFPSPRRSDELLDELRREDVKATFFCIGQDAEKNPALIKRAIREGHEIEIHSWSHDAANPELDRCVKLLTQLGAHPSLYRAPGSETIKDLQGQPIQTFTVDPYDYQRPGTTELSRRILSQVRNGAVLQLHVGVSDTLESLPKLIQSLRARGFQFDLMKPSR